MPRDQHTVGIPEKRRGQQMGFAGQPDQNRQEMAATPAIKGLRKRTNKMAGDKSEQHVRSDATTPSTNTPSTPGMNAPARSETGGATVFKRRLSKKRSEP
jgi:hypothetical protein